MALAAIKLAPSILAADFVRLGEQVVAAETAGADRIHVDAMDGHFVPNLGIGTHTVRCLRPATRLPLEVHLMVQGPEHLLELFAKAGADRLIIHQEATANLDRAVQAIKGLGKRAGVAINPATPAMLLADILPEIDLVIVMTVNPGFGGQRFIESMLPKIAEVRRMIDALGRGTELEVDGGIDAATAPRAVAAGANVLVAGTAVFGHPGGVAGGMDALRASFRP